MTIRQQLLKAFYPILLLYENAKGGKKFLKNTAQQLPDKSFYSLTITLNNGEEISFEQFRNKKVLIVNTASNCGYTAQLKELQTLFEKSKDRLVILAFPSNNFHGQEPGSDEKIAEFCTTNYKTTFPLSEKSDVIGTNQNKVFQWLTNKNLNGWNDQLPTWNFSKYLINESGILTHVFYPQLSPLNKIVKEAIES